MNRLLMAGYTRVLHLISGIHGIPDDHDLSYNCANRFILHGNWHWIPVYSQAQLKKMHFFASFSFYPLAR